MPAVTRELSIAYAGVTIAGSSSAFLLTDRYRIDLAYERGSFDAEVLVVGTSEADFATQCAALETAFRTPRGTVLIKVNNTNLTNVSHSGNTGYNGEPYISKAGSQPDTVRTRLYRVGCRFEMPADLSGQSGRRDSTVTLARDPAKRRTLTITGRYTALGGNGARAQYNASIGAYQASLISSVGGGATYKQLSEDVSTDDADKNCSFTRVLQEVFYGATSSNLDHPSIIDHRITYSRLDPSPGDTPGHGTKRLAEVGALFEAYVDHTVETDVNSLFTAVEGWMLAQIQSKFSPSGTAILAEDRGLDMTSNRLHVRLVVAMSIGATGSISFDRTVEIFNEYGNTLIPVWDGNPLAKHTFQGPAVRVKRTREIETVTGAEEVSVASSVGQSPASFSGGNWVRRSRTASAHQRELGMGSAKTFIVTDIVTELVEEWAEKPKGSGGPITPGTGSPGAGGPFDGPGGGVPPGIDRSITPDEGGNTQGGAGPGGGTLPDPGANPDPDRFRWHPAGGAGTGSGGTA